MNKKIAILISLLAIGNVSFSTSLSSIAKSVVAATTVLGSSEAVCVREDSFNIDLDCAHVPGDSGWPNANNPIFSDENCESILAGLCVGHGFRLEGDFCFRCTEWLGEEIPCVDSRAVALRADTQVGYYYSGLVYLII